MKIFNPWKIKQQINCNIIELNIDTVTNIRVFEPNGSILEFTGTNYVSGTTPYTYMTMANDWKAYFYIDNLVNSQDKLALCGVT